MRLQEAQASIRVEGLSGPLARKISRLTKGEPPRVLDLFSGCGGISLGFHREGCAIVANVEHDPDAALSHALNFHSNSGPEALARHSVHRDITALEPSELATQLGLGPVEDAVDILVGGPPCQAYSRIGRAKLREIAGHPEAYRFDARRNLYQRYLAYVQAFRPLALLMENVPDILNQAGQNVVEGIVATLSEMGYEARYSLVNSAFHGVPQTRDRVILVAFLKELEASICFPSATRHLVLPSGYHTIRRALLKQVDQTMHGSFVPADGGGSQLPGPVTAREAISDLPFVAGSSLRLGPRRFSASTWLPYRTGSRPGPFAMLMREWPGFSGGDGVIDHAIRYLPRDEAIFRAMPDGAEYPEAVRIADELFEEAVAKRNLLPGTSAYDELRRAMVPPYDPQTFPNRWWKLRRDAPARTLLAHLGRDCYTHIHYDRRQGRTISVREAARLQSFPDGFRFAGSMNSAFKQIGNAVPPLLAAAMAAAILGSLRAAVARLVTLLPSRASGGRSAFALTPQSRSRLVCSVPGGPAALQPASRQAPCAGPCMRWKAPARRKLPRAGARARMPADPARKPRPG